MPRRIDIELTSSRDDGTWTWRAAGARQPKGVLSSTVLPEGAKVGDVLKVDAEFYIDGIEITGVVASTRERREPERLELISPAGRDEPLVTTTLAPKGRGERGPRRGRRDGERGDRHDRGDRSERGDRRERRGADGRRGSGSDRPRRSRPEPPPMPAIERPKAKRLKAGKAHRKALLESLPEAERPIAEQVVLGGLPAVRQAIEKQNAELKAAGQSPIDGSELIALAEKLVPKVRAAEWRDRAEAAQRDIDVIDLRDLRSVVSAADAAGKDAESRALADSLKASLLERVEAEHALWLQELAAILDVGRVVRALRHSSRPPKPGAPLPPDIAARLVEATNQALTSEASPERWVAVLDALAFSPVRDKVIPASLPTELHADVRATIARFADRIPKFAEIFQVEPDRNAPRPKMERRKPRKQAKAAQPAKARSQERDEAPKDEAPKDEAPKDEAPEEQAPETPEAPEARPDAPEADASQEQPPAEVPEPVEPEATADEASEKPEDGEG